MRNFFGERLGASANLPGPPSAGQSSSLILLTCYSQNGTLTVNLLMQNVTDVEGFMHYCYIYMYQGQQIEAPTLRLNPGDTLVLNLTNNLEAPFDRYNNKIKTRCICPACTARVRLTIPAAATILPSRRPTSTSTD